MGGRKENSDCTKQILIHDFQNLQNTINFKWKQIRITIFQYFEGAASYFGSFPCAICNPMNSGFFNFDKQKDTLTIKSHSIGCLNQVYQYQLLFKMTEILKTIIDFNKTFQCFIEGSKLGNYVFRDVTSPNPDTLVRGIVI